MVYDGFLMLLPSLSMVFDGSGPLVKRCNGFDGSLWSNLQRRMVVYLIQSGMRLRRWGGGLALQKIAERSEVCPEEAKFCFNALFKELLFLDCWFSGLLCTLIIT